MSETENNIGVRAKKRGRGQDTFALKDAPVFAVVVVLLFTLGIVLLPGEKLGALLLGEKGTDARNLGNALFRAVGVLFMLWLVFDLGWDVFSLCGKGVLLSLPFLAVVAANAPIGGADISASAESLLIFAFNCLMVGLFEETVFRGVLLPLCLRRMSPDRKGTFWAVVLSSALFGAVHLVNLFSSAPLPVLLQVGYSFLVGAMCAIVLLLCRNVFVCALLHAAFNFCGLMADELGGGQVWNALSVTVMAVVSAGAVAYGIWLLCKKIRPESGKTEQNP